MCRPFGKLKSNHFDGKQEGLNARLGVKNGNYLTIDDVTSALIHNIIIKVFPGR
jgi:hypothetical protein